MQFRFSEYGLAELNLPDTLRGRVFSGPSIKHGLLAGWPNGVNRWAKTELNKLSPIPMNLQRLTDLDPLEARILYYVIGIRNVDHTLLPITRWDDLAELHFEVVPHVVPGLDPDGDCSECSAPVDSPELHLPAPEPVPPTKARAGTDETL